MQIQKKITRWMVEAYGYIAAYNANTKKDYPMAISFFQKLLEVDPQNADAQKYIAVLEQRGAKDEAKTN
jgi:cytochrome c-type biogenesis protein CcmH/NrfG